jgi:hypothetical protein
MIAKLTSRAALRGQAARELVDLLAKSGRWWLLPMVGVLGLASLLLVAVAAVEYVAPFVYTVF